jgi:adenosylcobinamide hydrolase
MRSGRFLIAELHGPHRVLSTSVRNGGQREGIRYLVNHQSCEGADHRERHLYMSEMGQEGYHDEVCRELGLNCEVTAIMGTAANMNYACVVERRDRDLHVTAVVTAGVQGNAACAGDPAAWRETEGGWEKIAPLAGTINTMLLLNMPVTEGALARAVVTMTEAKTAALQRLAVRSLYSRDAATGTGTDQYAVAAPLEGGKAFTSTGPHAKLGELIGVAVRDAMLEALRWQNGLEPSYTRSIFHALGRYGLNESSFFDDIAPQLEERELELLRRNSKAVFYEPLVAAAAYAMAAVLDRIRYDTLPASAAAEALRQQAASMAASVAARADRWVEFYESLRAVDVERPADIILAAIARGWSAKWK